MSDPTTELPPDLQLAFEPLHKRAFGMATGSATGLFVFFLTAVYLLRGPEPGLDLYILDEYFYGYSVTGRGAFVGLFWGFIAGFVAGWFIAFCRNVVIALSLWLTRTRAELAASRDFLDHI